MSLESLTGIWSFNAANPVSAADMVAIGANHLRGIKSALLYSFPNVTGIVTPTHTQLNTVPDLAPKASPVLTGTPVAPTATSGDDSTQIANTAFVTAAILAAGTGTLSIRSLDKGRLEYYGG